MHWGTTTYKGKQDYTRQFITAQRMRKNGGTIRIDKHKATAYQDENHMTLTHEWRDTTRIPKGMSDFKRWYQGTKGIADVDGIVHNKANDNIVMLEFKPQASRLTVGQEITLTAFSKKEGCAGIAVFDPMWNDTSREDYEDDMLLKVIIFIDGKQVKQYMTVPRLNTMIDGLLGIMGM